MDFAILQSGLGLSDCGLCKFAVWFESLRRFGSVASLPIESSPCFPRMASQRRGSSSPSSGDPYNSEKAGASCWSPRTWHTDNNFGLRAEDTALRSFAPRDSGRRIRVRTRREVRLEPSACCAATLQRSLSKPQTCSLCAKPACCDFARLALRISQHRSARSKRKPRYRLCTIFGSPDELGNMPHGIRTGIGPLRKEARLFGHALCQLLSNSAEEPTQASTIRHVRSGPRQLVVLLPARALHMTSIAWRTARACLGTASALFFW